MTKPERDEEREERISMRIVVDAYEPHERVMGWQAYLADTMQFPFEARCIEERAVSPLETGETARVLGTPPVDACGGEMTVTIRWMDREFGVPLAQLEPIDVDPDTERAVADWHYWVRRGYSF